MATFFQKLVNAFKSWRFNRQKAAAIRQAQQLANVQNNTQKNSKGASRRACVTAY